MTPYLASNGRLDTGELDHMAGLNWVFPDDPFTPLSPVVFQRQYYEPRLLPRLLADAAGHIKPEDRFDHIDPLQSLNRVQPNLTIARVKPDGPITVSVTVQVENVRHEYQRDQNKVMWSGAKDIRLFRDGQLVGSWPDNQPDIKEGGPLLEGGAITAPKTSVYAHCFPHIQLPRQAGSHKIAFTAYAFNTDDVRSETTSPYAYPITDKSPHRKAHAYLISMGVSAYQNKHWNLDFAANDAHKVVDALTPRLKAEFEVIPVLLTSTQAQLARDKTVTATKRNLADVLAILSGKKARQDLTPEQRKRLPNVDKLGKATPEDLVMVFFSGHGDNMERFYMYPYDIGPGKYKTKPAKKRCISSDELAYWIRDIDAGDTVLIVDACHAAATLGAKFKPGPLGSRGMGQLAYDKGMRVLAATQADDTALEVNVVSKGRKIQQGLLTYALVNEGLEAHRAWGSKKQALLLSGWLAYAEGRVPELQAQVLGGSVKSVSKGVRVRVVHKGPKGEGGMLQQPEFFDFTAKIARRRAILLTR